MVELIENGMKVINFDMRNQVKLFVGERSKTPFDSGCKMFDIFLHDPFEFELITFQNFYTAYLSIKVKEKYPKKSNDTDWKILVKRMKLMDNAHGETGANNFFKITKDMIVDKDLRKISQLRFILQQPSMYWKDFGIDDLRFKIKNSEESFEKALEDYSKKCEKIKISNFENLPPIDLVSSKLQNLWLICNETSKLTKNELEDNPAFDVDGSYEVNLLSYNSV